MARPRKKIDEEKLILLASLGLSYAEMAGVLDCSHDTLERRYAAAIKKGHLHRKAGVCYTVRARG